MANYAKPAFTVQEVNAAAKQVAKFFTLPDDEFEQNRAHWAHAIDVIDNFRATHAFPLNTFLMTLKNRATSIHGSSLSAQRIKRLASIVLKLLHQDDMKLSQMQDIGGCRAIVPTLTHLYKLRELYFSRPLTHKYNGEKDYIVQPKDTGYRGIHLKYRFVGKGTSLPWDGLKIEMQLRTELQHKWATAVEAAGTLTKEALKSNRGSQEWLRFFALMSSVFAMREGCSTIPGTPQTMDETRKEIAALNSEHRIQSVFAQFRKIIPHIEKRPRGAAYFLVTLDPINMNVNIQSFKKEESQQANKAYSQAETAISKSKSMNVVLVSTGSVTALKRAYPNYFLDTEDFLREVSLITQEAVIV